MKILVCGSRDWTDGGTIADVLADHLDATVITGGCKGADTLAMRAAGILGIDVLVMHANWTKHGKAAGPIRNRAMLDQGPDLVIAFHKNGSRGTQDTITEARRRGIPVEVVHDKADQE